MERVKVDSSAISEIGYDNDEALLEITFKRGVTFRYFDVPHTKIFELITADSIGSYFMKNIKDKFECKKVESKNE